MKKKGNLLSGPSVAPNSSIVLPSRYNKRAVLCGVSYSKKKFKLKGAINDINNMRELLIKNFKFPNECIRVLTEQEKNANLIPTKHNILESLRWLVKDCQAGDSLVFYFSGHGLQQPDFKEDEIDGFDETLCPVDFMKEGMIIDNDINSTIVWPLKKGVTLHAIVDACHSGTILDLLYVLNMKGNGIWEDNKPPSKEPMRKHTSGGLAICLSACEDSQTATDSAVFGGKGMNGVLTYLFTKTIRECPEITYGHLLQKMHEEIKKINNRSRCNNRFLQFHRKIAQDPLLSSSEKFDVSTTKFTLSFQRLLNAIMTSSVNSNMGYGTTHLGYYPQLQPLRPSYPLIPPSPYGSKRAVLCGICYHGRSYRLKGSVNDVKCMKYFLINQFGFPSDSILMLTDDKEDRNPLRIPTRYNIQMALRWLLEGSRSGDSLVFHFSGHGTQEVNMDKIHGYDRAICPVDYEHKGKMLSDEINATIVRPLPSGTKLHAIIDACHSGTVLDLSFVCKMNREGYYTWEDQGHPIGDKGTKGGLAICISACDDGQISMDTSALSGKEVTGVLTYSFIQTMQNEPGLTYGRLLSAMRSTIHGTKAGIVVLNGPIASLLNRILGATTVVFGDV
ncbi:Caspase-like domain superfamily [Sesbania bispinosa]|nr:Caspase-like domain superfamily [Sesbania bispinosa]